MRATLCFAASFILCVSISCKTANSSQESETKNVVSVAADYWAGIDGSELLEFDPGITAKVSKNVNSKIYYRVFSVKGDRPLDVCYLQHGHGIDTKLMGYLMNKFVDDFGYDLFWKIYFGESTPRLLLDSACKRVVIGLQESTDTSILEMTERTEIFLRDRICSMAAVGRCAYIGHSKGGAVATNIARRCMQSTSLLEEWGCARLKKIYSSTGVSAGTLLAVLAHGITLDEAEGKSGTTKLQDIGNIFSFNFLMNSVMGSIWNLEPYKVGETNPMWWDLSPAAPMENGKSLYEVNNTALTKTGWLKADYYATGSTTDFGKGELAACGSSLKAWNTKHAALCAVLVRMIPKFQDPRLKEAFERGRKSLIAMPDVKAQPVLLDYLNHVTFADYQKGDGLVNNSSLLLTCKKSLKSADLPNGAALSCYEHNKLNHLATTGGAKEVIDHIVTSLNQR
jgi:hypothetical protein